MPEIGTYGSVGGAGERSPAPTRPYETLAPPPGTSDLEAISGRLSRKTEVSARHLGIRLRFAHRPIMPIHQKESYSRLNTVNGRSGKLFAAVTLAGLGGFGVCTFRHFCMCGHMQHPPFQWWEYAIDVSWVVLFLTAAVIAVARWKGKGLKLAVLLSLLIVCRLTGAGCMGMQLFLFELPASVALLLRSFGALVEGPRR
jgi:hypothetical protein